jgi:hypothetical protein
MPTDFVASGEISQGTNYGIGENAPTQEYIDQMAAKADAGLGTPKADPQGTLLAGKYKSEEDLQKGILELAKKHDGGLEAFYKSLEKGFGKAESSPDENTATENDTEEKTEDKQDAPKASDMSSAIDLASNEWVEKGEISDETFASLEKSGLPRPMVEAFIAGQEALAEKATTEILNIIGGPQAFEHMKSWAMENCTPEEITLFNKAIVSNNMASVKMAVRAMNDMYIEREGKAPNLLRSSTPNMENVGGFESKAQMTAAMRDPRYSKDPAFRQEVMERIRLSKF